MLNRSICKTLLGLAFLLLGLFPFACVVENEGEVIVLRIALPGSVGDSDFVVVTLTEPGKDSSWIVYEGPAPARGADSATRTLRRQVPGYQGGDAMVLIQVYRTSSGAADRDPLDLTGETQYRLTVLQGRDTAIGIDTLLRSTPYPEFPKDGSDGEVGQGLITLAWNAASMPLPAPAYTLYFGTSNPPPLLGDKIKVTHFQHRTELADTVYYWQLKARRGEVQVTGPVWSFRTRPRAPQPFFYPADSVLHAGEATEVLPAYDGGRARFTVSPELPQGLALDPFTGRIHGTPLASSPLKEHTVTASNISGSASAKVRIGVGQRILGLMLSDSLRVGADSVTVELRATSGALLHRFILVPPPKEARFRREVPAYDGGEATVILRGYASDSGLPPFVQWEEKRRLNQILGVNEGLPFSLPAPVLTSPADGYAGPYAEEGVDSAKVDLGWDLPENLDPLARVHLLVGTDNSPTSYYRKDLQLSGEKDSVSKLSVGKNSTRHWQVEIEHAGRKVRSAVRTFHALLVPPSDLEYLQDSVPTAGRPVRIHPVFNKSNGPVLKALRYSISPALPPGLALDSLTGAINGSFPAPAPRTEYTVTVRNPKGTLELPLAFRARPAMPASPRMVANYKQANTLTLVDETVFGHHGVLQGNVKPIPGVSGEGIELDGRSYATIGVTPALELDAFTISLWFRPDDQDSTDPLLEYSVAGGLVGVAIWANTAGDGKVIPGAVFCNLRPIDASAKQLHDIRERNTFASKKAIAKIGAWNHLALAYDAKSQGARLYVNGRLESDTVFATSFTPLTRGRILVGYRSKDTAEWDANHSFKGGLDEIQIWEGALGAAEIEAYYRSLAPTAR